MKWNAGIIVGMVIGLFLLSCGKNSNAPVAVNQSAAWVSVKPESVGFSSTELDQVGQYATQIHSPAGMVIVHGKMIYSWGDLTQKMWVHSIRKSFLNALMGI